MLINLSTFNGHAINDGTSYRAVLLNPHGVPSAKPVYLEQTQADALDAGTYTLNTQTKVLSITIRNYAQRHALIAQLKTWFRPGTDGNLVATFSDDGVDYLLPCRAVSLAQDAQHPLQFTATLQTGTSAWRAVDATVIATWTVTGTSETLNVDVGGKDETYLSATLNAVTGPASGYLHQDLYRLVNTPGVAHGLIPYCITVNTAALIAAGKMQEDCDDLRIVDMNTGQELKRWITGANTTTTKVWVNLDFIQGFSLILGTSVAGSGSVSYLQFKVTTDSKNKIAKMPATGIIYHGNEWFYYTATDALKCRLTIGKRGLFGTTEEAHSANDVFYYIQYPLLMKYGNSSVAAPSTTDANYDDDKPLINLTSSSNTSWVWDATTKFYDPDHPNRTGGWKFAKKALGPNSKYYHVKADAESGDPAIGLKVASFQSGATWKAENVVLSATLFHGATITNVSMTGDKYRNNANWLSLAALRRSANGTTWANLWTEAKPASVSTVTAWTHNSVSVTGNSKYLQLIFQGGYAAAADAYAYIQGLTCTATISSTYLPTGTFLGEVNSYPLDVVFENLTTGDAINLDYMMILGKSFVLDGEANTASYDNYSAFDAVTMDDDSRDVFIRLQGGVTNQLQISGGDLGEMDIDLSYYKRRL